MKYIIITVAATLVFFQGHIFGMDTNKWKTLNKKEKSLYLLKKVNIAKEIHKKRFKKLSTILNTFDDTCPLLSSFRYDTKHGFK
jgi:hypothetical protein